MPDFTFKGTRPLSVIQTVIIDCVSLSFECAEVTEVSFTNLQARRRGWELKYLPFYESKVVETLDIMAKVPPFQPAGDRELVVYLGILSQPGRFDMRLAQRETFMTHELVRSGRMVFRFFVSFSPSEVLQRAMELEAREFGDMVLLGETEFYVTINYKVYFILRYFSGPEWAAVTSSGEEVPVMIGKTDDDVYVDVGAVYLELLSKREDAKGMTLFGDKQKSSVSGNWFWTTGESREYKKGIPTYPSGTFYLASGPLVRWWIESEEERGGLVAHPMEDRQTGLWISEYERRTGRSVVWNKVSGVTNDCVSKAHVVHHVLPGDIRCLHESVLSTGSVVCCVTGGVVWH